MSTSVEFGPRAGDDSVEPEIVDTIRRQVKFGGPHGGKFFISPEQQREIGHYLNCCYGPPDPRRTISEVTTLFGMHLETVNG